MLTSILTQGAPDAFMPHGMCYLWQEHLVWLHVVSDSLTTLAYWAIPPFLVYFALKARHETPASAAYAQKRLPYDWLFIAFGVFIVACGATHAMGIWTIWEPRYWLEGGIKAVTAVASVATAAALPPLVPRALDLIRNARESEVRRVELEEAQEARRELVGRLREANEAKSRFVAGVSHDLRTPLSLIQGPTRELLERDLPRDVREKLETVLRNARTLGGQVENLLTVAQMEAQELEAEREPVDVAALVRTVADHYRAHAAGRGIDFRVEGPESLVAAADGDLVKRALLNLLSNAFEHTPDGGTVRCGVRRSGEEVRLVVSDSGPGVALDERDAVFRRFRQGRERDGAAEGGTGLGLAIVREVAEAHGGGVELDDAPEGGARFTLRWPARPGSRASGGPGPGGGGADAATIPEETAARPHPAETGSEGPGPSGDRAEGAGARPAVLVVEDDADMARHLGDLLGEDYEVAFAADGRAGLEKALTLRPDLIVTDMMMPEMDGADLVDEVRKREELSDTPVLVLTARAERELPERMLRAGAQDFVLKPVEKGELLARVENLLELTGSRRLLQDALESTEESLEGLARMAARRKEELEATVEEKKLLMRELHHRVKGNLQTVTSLLQLQLRNVDDEEARRSLEESRDRVSAMGLLHEKLYRSGSPDRVELSGYLRSLVADVVRTQDPGPGIRTETKLRELVVPVEDAVACGLIVHELVTNGLGHAFPGSATGTVRIELRREGDEGVLVVADDGEGMGREDGLGERGLGLQLVESLVKQLDGRLDMEADDGTRIEIVFPLRAREETESPGFGPP